MRKTGSFAKRIEKVPIGFPIIFQRHNTSLFPNKRPRSPEHRFQIFSRSCWSGCSLRSLTFKYFVRLEADTGGVHHFEIPVQGLRIPGYESGRGGIEAHSLVKVLLSMKLHDGRCPLTGRRKIS